MPLDTEVELGLRDILFIVDPATPRKKAHSSPPNFWPVYCGQMARWMKTTLGTEVDFDPSHIVLDAFSAPAKGAQQPPILAHVYCGHSRPSQLLLASLGHPS